LSTLNLSLLDDSNIESEFEFHRRRRRSSLKQSSTFT